MAIKLVIYKSGKTYKNQKGDEVEGDNLALELDNGTRIVIKNVYKDDYKLLKVLAERR